MPFSKLDAKYQRKIFFYFDLIIPFWLPSKIEILSLKVGLVDFKASQLLLGYLMSKPDVLTRNYHQRERYT